MWIPKILPIIWKIWEMIKFASAIGIFIGGFVILLSMIPNKAIYDCNMINTPNRVDIPIKVIIECQQRGVWAKK